MAWPELLQMRLLLRLPRAPPAGRESKIDPRAAIGHGDELRVTSPVVQ
jgi:hypothetical protein